jgi:NAD(P)-dependent dehydrogenase (short-subunit alcohol dehydrogenase family)
MNNSIHPLFDLHGRVAIVTGGGDGLGREFCEILAEFGADVVCPDLIKERSDETCDIIKKYGHRVLPLMTDVREPEQVRAMFKRVKDDFGKVDILVNNAGITSKNTMIHQMDIQDWLRVINTDLNGVFYCMREGLGIMFEQKKGVIVNISSVAALVGYEPDILLTAHYTAAKSAVIGLTREAATEYGPYGIRVNAIAPGWHGGTKLGSLISQRTPEQKEAFEKKLVERTPMKRRGLPRELKGLMLYLCSDASSFVTGQTITHDGGWSSW